MNETRKLRLKHKIVGDFVFVEKIPGLNTHAPDPGKPGLCELLQEDLGRPLFVVHRLDKGTSGALCFALNADAAARAAALFESRQVKKKYLFISDKAKREDEFTIESKIEKRGDKFVSETLTNAANAKTDFKRVKTMANYDLWEATPHTGKPHQIRLHAADAKINILGDVDHGGKKFPRLALHSKELVFADQGKTLRFEAAMPIWANDLPLDTLQLFDVVQRRACLFDLSAAEDECLRWVHRETIKYRIDQFGPQLWISWYGDAEPSPTETKVFEFLSKTFKKPVYIRRMSNRGKDPNAQMLWKIGTPRERWLAQENGLRYEFRADSGQSPGLFLDQRENRWWLRQHCRDKKVLNLFSYTAGFSLNAAAGGAKEVCTVDVSGAFHDWAGINFQLNAIDPKAAHCEFWEQDTLLFLKGCSKRGRKFDFIICDPPSFGRSKEGVFQINKDLPALVEACFQCLEKDGQLLLSTNYESWTQEQFEAQAAGFAKSFKGALEKAPMQGLDFELPGEEPLLKAVILRKL